MGETMLGQQLSAVWRLTCNTQDRTDHFEVNRERGELVLGTCAAFLVSQPHATLLVLSFFIIR